MSRSLGSLRIDLVALTGKFEANFRTAQGVLQKFGVATMKVATLAKKALGGFASSIFSIKTVLTGTVAAIGVSRIVHSLNEASEAVDVLGKRAKVLGMSIEDLSVLRFAAGEANIDFEELSNILGKASRNLGEFASTGGGKAADALKKLGIGVQRADGSVRSMVELLPEIASALSSIGDPSKKLDLSEKIFGKGNGAAFIQLLDETGGSLEGLAGAAEKASKLGVVFSDEQSEKLKNYNDAVYRLGQSWMGVKVQIMTQVAPVLTEFVDSASLAIARLPVLFANTMKVVADAINGDEKSKDRLLRFVASVGTLLREAFKVIGNEVGIAFITAISSRFVEWAEKLPFEISRVYNEAMLSISENLLPGFLADRDRKIYGDRLDSIYTELGAIGRRYTDARYSQSANPMRLDSSFLSDYKNLAAAVSEFAASADDISGWSKAVEDAGKAAEVFGKKFEAGTKPVREADWPKWEAFFNGMRQEWESLSAEAEDFGTLGRNVFGEVARGISGNLASALAKGEASFKNFGETIRNVVVDVVQNVAQMILQFYFMRAIVGTFGGMFSTPVASTGAGGGLPDLAGPSVPTYAAHGGVFGFANGGIASGVLNGPTAFPFSRKVGVAGEAGAEVGFAPLRRIGGELGVAATGGDVTVQIVDQRGSGARPEVSSTRSDDGKKTIRILIRDEVRRGIGEGEFDKVLGANFGLGRKGTKR